MYNQSTNEGTPMSESPFNFVGEALAFDFVNTQIVARRKPVDLLQSADDLRAWWASASQHYDLTVISDETFTDALLAEIKAFRDALRRLFNAVVQNQSVAQADIGQLNAILKSSYPQVVNLPDGQFTVAQVSDEQNRLPLMVAQSALWLLTGCERERLHKCKNCMNRARSAEHYLQEKQG
jgi:predicted RNA-binding Zn ribbon-like protein